MYNIKPGNDLTVRWALFHTDGTPFPLVNYEYRLFYSTARGKSEETESGTLSVDGNILTWIFRGEKQTAMGEYDLQLKVMFNGRMIATLNKSNAFTLSSTGVENPIGLTLELKSYCDYIAIQDAVQMARHAVDEAAGAAQSAEEAATLANEAATLASEAAEVAGSVSIVVGSTGTSAPGSPAVATGSWDPSQYKLTIDFVLPRGEVGPMGPRGYQGNTGSSIDYPFELVNNLETDDPTKGLSAAMGKVLYEREVWLTEDEYFEMEEAGTLDPEKIYCTYEE